MTGADAASASSASSAPPVDIYVGWDALGGRNKLFAEDVVTSVSIARGHELWGLMRPGSLGELAVRCGVEAVGEGGGEGERKSQPAIRGIGWRMAAFKDLEGSPEEGWQRDDVDADADFVDIVGATRVLINGSVAGAWAALVDSERLALSALFKALSGLQQTGRSVRIFTWPLSGSGLIAPVVQFLPDIVKGVGCADGDLSNLIVLPRGARKLGVTKWRIAVK